MDLNIFKLNEVQKNVVSHSTGPALVIAGAGTGKTRVLTARIAYLVGHFGISPHRILAITFTNKAAEEMKNRISRYLPDISFPFIHTFHAFSLRFLKEEIHHLDYNSSFNVIDEISQRSIINDLYRLHNFEKSLLKTKESLDYIDTIKAANGDFKTSIENIKLKNKLSPSQCDLLKSLLNHYQNHLKKNNLVDFNDLLNFTYEILSTNEEVKKKWIKRFDCILIDEFQDTNKVQYQIAKFLAITHQNIFVVGDPDQSIYSWRGADEAIIEKFKQTFPNVKTFVLEENYRSSQQILNVANDLIKNNYTVNIKNLWSHNKSGSVVKYYAAFSQEEEAFWVANQIKNLTEHHVKNQDIVILYRINSWSRIFEQALIKLKIPYFIYGGYKFYERQEIKDIIAYLKVIAFKDEISLKRIINVPSRKVASRTIDAIDQYAAKLNVSFYDAMKNVQSLDIYSIAKKNILNFYFELQEWRKKVNNGLFALTDHILTKTNYLSQFDPVKEKDRHENIKELLNSIQTYENDHPNASLSDYLQDISLYTSIDEKEQRDSVRLMTIHSAKGLEFNYVFVVGLNERIFPIYRNSEDSESNEIKEERRIFYVAITRAKKELTITSAIGFSYASSTPNQLSRFIDEIDRSHLNIINLDKIAMWKQKNASSNQFGEFSWPHLKALQKYEHLMANAPNFRVGEVLDHDFFGEGVVVEVLKRTVKIAFNPKFGVKEILSVSATLKRRKN